MEGEVSGERGINFCVTTSRDDYSHGSRGLKLIYSIFICISESIISMIGMGLCPAVMQPSIFLTSLLVL